MNTTISPTLRDDPFVQIYLGRSKQKFDGGLRTRRQDSHIWPLTHQGRRLDGDFLISTYVGGVIGVITTPTWQWVGPTVEMDQGEGFARNHSAKARRFVAEISPQQPNEIRDGQHRH